MKLLILMLAGLLVSMLIGSLSSCAAFAIDDSPSLDDSLPQESTPPKQHVAEAAGDEALPALKGEYSYVLAEATLKEPESDSLEIKVLSWESLEEVSANGKVPRGDSFIVGEFPAGTIGTVLCTELVLYPGGIQYGTPIVIAYKTAETAAFPLTAYAIEKLDWFESRIERANDA